MLDVVSSTHSSNTTTELPKDIIKSANKLYKSSNESPFKTLEIMIMASLFIFGASMIATGLIFIFLRDKTSRLQFEKRVNKRLKKLGVEPGVRKLIRENEKDAITRSQTESPNLSNTSLISNL